MDKIKSELKYNEIVKNDNMAVEIIKDYMKRVKLLWITIMVLLSIIITMFIDVGRYDLPSEGIVLTALVPTTITHGLERHYVDVVLFDVNGNKLDDIVVQMIDGTNNACNITSNADVTVYGYVTEQ